MSGDTQIIYILTNPAMPGLIKIGKTGQADVEDRMRQLYGTGVPFPFECNYACRVKDGAEAEKALHFAFGDHRVNSSREFFRLAPERVVAILKMLQEEEVTSQVTREIESETGEDERNSGERFKRSRRPNMNFVELGIPIGSVLKFRDGTVEVKVISEKKVDYKGEPTSLTAATRKILSYEDDYPLQPSPHWTFNGKRLDEIYEDYHSDEDAA